MDIHHSAREPKIPKENRKARRLKPGFSKNGDEVEHIIS